MGKGETMKTDPITRSKILNARELVQLYTWIAVHEHEPEWSDPCFLVRFVLGGGFRVSEVPGLRVPEDCEPGGVIHVWMAKGGKFRYARLIPEIMPHYERRLWEIGRGLLFPRRDPRVDPQVPYSTRTFQKWWDAVLEAAGVHHVSIHGARHTYAVNELHRLRDFEVRDLLGHTSLAITHGYYSHVDVDNLYTEGAPAWRAMALGNVDTGRKLRVVK